MNGEEGVVNGLIWDIGGQGVKVLRDVGSVDPVALVLFVLFAVGAVYAARWYGMRRRKKALRLKWGAKMSRPEQFKYEQRVIADMLEDAILSAEAEGYLSHERAKVWRGWFANILDNPDLLSKSLTTLKKRLQNNQRKRLMEEDNKPLPIPEPPAVVGNVIHAEKKFNCKFLDRKVA